MMPETYLSNNIQSHLRTEPNPHCEFSSWAASLEVALWFYRVSDTGERCLAVLDTQDLSNGIFHVQQLWRAGFLRNYNADIYTAEYLVHGKIDRKFKHMSFNGSSQYTGRGTHYFCRNIGQLKDAGLATLMTTRLTSLREKQIHKILPQPMGKVTKKLLVEHTKAAVRVAKLLTGDQHSEDGAYIFLAATFLGFRYERYEKWTLEHLELIFQTIMIEASSALQVQPFFWDGLWLEHNVVYALGYPEISRTLAFLQYMKTKRVIDGYRTVQPDVDGDEDDDMTNVAE
jgi:hypothetical protein